MTLEFDAASHTYRLDGLVLPSVTQILHPYSALARVPDIELEPYRRRGQAVHTACQFDDEGDLDEASVDVLHLGYLQAWRLFSAEWKVKWDIIERPVHHDKMLYAGTPDRIGSLSPPHEKRRIEAVTVDIKSGSSDAIHGPQTAAYKAAYQLPPAARRFCVYLAGDGTYKWHEFSEHASDFAVFVAALTLHNFKERHGNR